MNSKANRIGCWEASEAPCSSQVQKQWPLAPLFTLFFRSPYKTEGNKLHRQKKKKFTCRLDDIDISQLLETVRGGSRQVVQAYNPSTWKAGANEL